MAVVPYRAAGNAALAYALGEVAYRHINPRRAAEAARRAFERLRQEARDPNSRSTLRRRIGPHERQPPPPSRPAAINDVPMPDRTAASRGSDYTKYYRKKGRAPRLSLRNLHRDVKRNTEDVILCARGLSDWGSLRGRFFLANQANTTNTMLYMPMHVYNLSGMVNNVGGTQTFPFVGPHVLRWGTAAAGFTWEATLQANQGSITDAAGVNTQNWVLERTTTGGGSAINPNKYSTWKWLDIRMLFYNPTHYPMRYKAMLVEFKDKFVMPVMGQPGPQIPSDVNDITDTNNF